MTKVKICGLSDKEAVQTAVNAGADYIGFVFAESRRRVSVEQVKELKKYCPETVKTVGVFLDQSLEEIETILKEVSLDYVQIHGQWDNRQTLSKPIIRAINIQNDIILKDDKADYYLFDAPIAGSGETFDWTLLSQKQIDKDYFLAGGLTAQNVKEAIEKVHPYAVDVSSGVETDGKKDCKKIKEFIEVVKYGI